MAAEHGVRAAVVTAIGSLKRAALGFYDGRKREYKRVEVDRPLELVSCSGIVSVVDGETHVHLHAVVSDVNSLAFGGHVLEGCEVSFTVEGTLLKVKGVKLARARAESDLMLFDA